MAKKIFLGALIFLSLPAVAPGDTAGTDPKRDRKPPAARMDKDGKGILRLQEVDITGSPEHPGVLFFLPRTRFHLLPLREEPDERGTPPAGPHRKGTSPR